MDYKKVTENDYLKLKDARKNKESAYSNAGKLSLLAFFISGIFLWSALDRSRKRPSSSGL